MDLNSNSQNETANRKFKFLIYSLNKVEVSRFVSQKKALTLVQKKKKKVGKPITYKKIMTFEFELEFSIIS
jgi:hypothetical protein